MINFKIPMVFFIEIPITFIINSYFHTITLFVMLSDNFVFITLLEIMRLPLILFYLRPNQLFGVIVTDSLKIFVLLI